MIKINKMNPYGEDELKKLFQELNDKLFDESGRGTILIATAYLDDFLTQLIEAVLPKNISKKNKERLFKYPGTLSSFSSKIELAYAFRLIEIELYNSLNALRSIRNDAAHSLEKFELVELNDKMKNIYNFHQGVYLFIKKISLDMIKHNKRVGLLETMEELKIANDERERMIDEMFEKDENKKVIEEQVPRYEVINGLCAICSILLYKRDSIKDLLKDIDTLDDLSTNCP